MLDDNTAFEGCLIGHRGAAVGEVVFNTAMTGYQEILTDPSYAGQIVCLTYPHIGNTGTNQFDCEADAVRCAGLIVRDVPRRASSWRNERPLEAWLAERGVTAISGADTRRLTRHLRMRGAKNGIIYDSDALSRADAEKKLRAFPGLKGMDLASAVGVAESYRWDKPRWRLPRDDARAPSPRYKVVAYDYGIKQTILSMLTEAGAAAEVVPPRTPAAQVIAANPDGVFLSNGPGDPQPCDFAIAAIQELLAAEIPLFGICLGHQLLSLACGATTEKMKFGHHGANHPVLELASGKVMITSQNHGFCVDEKSLPDCLEPTHRSLFDGTLQGVAHRQKPAFGFQGHPEASPGPRDIAPLFERFIKMIESYRMHAKAR